MSNRKFIATSDRVSGQTRITRTWSVVYRPNQLGCRMAFNWSFTTIVRTTSGSVGSSHQTRLGCLQVNGNRVRWIQTMGCDGRGSRVCSHRALPRRQFMAGSFQMFRDGMRVRFDDGMVLNMRMSRDLR